LLVTLRRFVFVTLCFAVVGPFVAAQSESGTWLDAYRQPAARIIAEATRDDFAWRRLALLTDVAGHRLSGTPQLDKAIQWAVAEMKRDGLENVHTEAVMVPKWVRGRESAEMLEPARHSIAMLGLGESVGTPAAGIQAEVLVVRSFDDLDQNAAKAKGRIVVFNIPFTTYNDSRPIRSNAATRAARYGGVAAIVRSVAPPGLRLAHTGSLAYGNGVAKIPGAAIATEDADRLQRMADRGEKIVIRLQMEAHFEPDVESANVIGEIRGREKPDEIVVVGGHLDSWDVGAGASDDGGGCVATWEALRLIKKLGLQPRRTVRVVLFTNEENGTRGARAYRDRHMAELANHVMMLEADDGLFPPVSFGVTSNQKAFESVVAIASLLKSINADHVAPGGGGSDIDPSVQAGKIPSLSYDGTGDYFVIHHTQADTVDKIDPADISRASAAVAVLTYVVADMPTRLGE
jgi:carboxypeptidase Q